MSELESFRPNKCPCALYYAGTVQFKALLSNLKFCGITKNARKSGRDLGAAISLNDPQEVKSIIKTY